MIVSRLEMAIRLAVDAHSGQVDKSGLPYIMHPLRVMGLMDIGDEVGQIVAVLHDIVEDTPVSLYDLEYKHAFGREIVDAVLAITRASGESYRDYIERCVKDPIARRVKIKDIQDNMSPLRRHPGDSGMYERYMKSLHYIVTGQW